MRYCFNVYYDLVPYYYRGISGYRVILTDEFRSAINNCITFHDYIPGVTSIPDIPHIYMDLPVISTFELFKGVICSELNITEFKLDNIVDISRMFYKCYSNIVYVKDFNTEHVLGMSELFGYSTVVIKDINMLEIDNWFTILKFNSTIDVVGILSYYHGSIEIDVSNISKSMCKSYESLFEGLSANLIGIELLKGSNVNNFSRMFCNYDNPFCGTVNLSNLDTRNGTSFSSMFENARASFLGLSLLHLDNAKYLDSMFKDFNSNIGYSKNIINMSNYNVMNAIDMSSMFEGFNGNLLNVNSINSINCKYFDKMFKNSVIYNYIDFSKLNLNYALSVKELFSCCCCTKLKPLRGVKKISNKFGVDLGRINIIE